MTPEQESILKGIADNQQKQSMRLRRIENVLTGDKEFGLRGMVEKVEYHGKMINEFKTDKVKITSIATALAAIAGFLSSVVHKLFSN